MKYLFLYTETTGQPKDLNFSPMAVDNWPRLVGVAYILCDGREIVEKKYSIIKPNGFIIPQESTRIHGITTSEALIKGGALSEILDNIRSMIDECDYIVGHNVIFDINVLNAEFYRYNESMPVSLKPQYCTMILSKDVCGLPNDKNPTLEELYSILKGESIPNTHNAMIYAQASMECFWILKDSGIVDTNVDNHQFIIYPTEDNIIWAAQQLSVDYVNKAYSYFTIAFNCYSNKYDFFKSKNEYDFIDNLFPDFIYTKEIDNSEWTNSMFQYFNERIQKEISSIDYNKYDDRTIIRRANRRCLIEFEKEVGSRELIDNFKLKDLDTPNVTLILENNNSWRDIVIEAVITRMIPIDGIDNKHQLSQVDAESYFISMINFFNETRRRKKIKRSEEWSKGIEDSLNPETLKKNLEVIKNYSSPYTSSSSGCMLILSIFWGGGSLLCFLISFLFNYFLQ